MAEWAPSTMYNNMQLAQVQSAYCCWHTLLLSSFGTYIMLVVPLTSNYCIQSTGFTFFEHSYWQIVAILKQPYAGVYGPMLKCKIFLKYAVTDQCCIESLTIYIYVGQSVDSIPLSCHRSIPSLWLALRPVIRTLCIMISFSYINEFGLKQ